MSPNPSRSFSKPLFALLSLSLAVLTGCGIASEDVAGSISSKGLVISGSVHGGVYPIQNATIKLMETQSNGTWNSATNSYKGTARALLITTSDKNGYFTFPDTGWTCDAGQYAYITVSSGHTLSNATNNNVVQVGVIGECSTTLANRTQIDNVNVFVSELSTVAAAYTLGGFITIDNTNGATGGQLVNITAPAINNSTAPGCTAGTTMTCTAAGLAHGFANAYNLVDSVRFDGSFPTGQARLTLPDNKNSQSVVPQAMINTLGNILQSCVDSPGGAANLVSGTYTTDGSHCGDLFQYATPPSGVAPTNTLQVAMNMARYPTNNVDSLFALQPRAVFFTPTLTSSKMSANSATSMSLTLSVFYTGTGLSSDPGMTYPTDIALDASDNAFVSYASAGTGSTYGAVNELAADGKGVFAGPRQTTFTNPSTVALDSVGRAWISDDTATGNIYRLNTPATSGATSATYGTIEQNINIPNGYPAGLALDYTDDIWISRDSADNNQSLFRLDAQSFASTAFRRCLTFVVTICNGNTPVLAKNSKRIVVDSLQNVFGVTYDTNATVSIFQFPWGSSGFPTNLTSSPLGTRGGYGIAMNNARQAFMPLRGELDTASGYTDGTFNIGSAGTNTSTSVTGDTYRVPIGVGIDGSNRIFWTNSETNGQLFMMTPTNGSVSTGKPVSIIPCLPINGVCDSSSVSNPRGLAIDSSGAIWYVTNSTTGTVVQTFGLASPTWPLTSYAHSGTPLQ